MTWFDALAGIEDLEDAEFDRALVDDFERRAQGVDPRLLQEAFLMPAPAADAISATGLTLANGDYALLQLHEVKPGDVTGLSDEERAQLRRELARMQGLTETAALVEDLRSRARISIPEQEN